MYILQQRLQAQGIPADKSERGKLGPFGHTSTPDLSLLFRS